MRNGNKWNEELLQETLSVCESIWQALKESGPCCGIRFDRKREVPTQPGTALWGCCGARM